MQSAPESLFSHKVPGGGAFVVSVFLSVLLCGGFTVWISAEPAQSNEIKLENRINPNTAPTASLVRLPGIGLSRAAAIVAYRENFARDNDGKAAFETADDLQKVKGIGPKTVEKTGQWLKFE